MNSEVQELYDRGWFEVSPLWWHRCNAICCPELFKDSYVKRVGLHTHAAIDKWVHTAIYGKPRSTSRRAWRKWRRRMYSQERRATAWMDLQEEAEKIQG